MITIFKGRKLSLDGTKDETYATIAVALRDMLHEFNTGKNLNPFAVFMKIALHADKDGWAWPGRGSIKTGTGLSSDAAISSAIKHLCQMRIDGHRVLSWYRAQDPDTKQWGWSLYRIFPDAFDETESIPKEFSGKDLIPQGEGPTIDNPLVDNPRVDNPGVDNLPRKYNQGIEVEPQGEGKKDSPPESKPDILDAMVHFATREQPEDWSSPENDWNDAVDAFAGLVSVDPSTLPKSTRREWSRVLQKVGTKWRASPPTVAHVIDKIPESQFYWKTYTGPHSAEDDLGVLIGQLNNGGIQGPKRNNGGGKPISQQIAEYRAKMAQTVEANYTIMKGEVL